MAQALGPSPQNPSSETPPWLRSQNPTPFVESAAAGQWELEHYSNQHHLVKELHAGAYGRFHNAITPLGAIIPMEDFQLPRLIVIGNQHRGKSSLLESITKCPIFPRGTGSFDTTTRAPVCLHMEHVKDNQDKQITVSFQPAHGRPVNQTLQQESEIIGVVQRIMDSIDKDTILDDEVVVTIRSPAMTTIEFVDLPGMVEDPPEKRRMTEALVQRYLEDHRNLFLCVEEASCSSLDSTQAVGRVRAAGRAGQTIMVLTKADLVDAEVMPHRLWRRILGSSRERIHQDFAGCVAVINSDHCSEVSLLDAPPHEVENKTFERKVFAKNPQMPQLMHLVEANLRVNLTIPNLIAQVEGMYRKHIIEYWQEAAQALLEPKVESARAELNQLGCPVEDLSVPDVLRQVSWQLNWPSMVHQLCCESNSRANWSIYTQQDNPQTLRELAQGLQDHSHQTMEHMQQLQQTVDAAMSGIEHWLDKASYLKILMKGIQIALSSSYEFSDAQLLDERSRNNYRLSRFHSLRETLVHQGLQRAVNTQQIKADLMADLKPIATMLRLQVMPLRTGLLDMQKAAHTAIVQAVFMPLRYLDMFVACAPNDFQLEESPADQQLRREAMTSLSNLQHALDVISAIHVQVDTAAAGPS